MNAANEEGKESSTVGEHEGQDHGPNPQTGPVVLITVDEKPVTIHRGSQTIAAIKKASGVDLADQLHLEKPGGGLENLDQDGKITIKGGEKFVSFRATGAAS